MAPPNDLIANAIDITPTAVPTIALPATPIVADITSATFAEDSSIPDAHGSNGTPSVWYTFKFAVETAVSLQPQAATVNMTTRPQVEVFYGPDSASTSQINTTNIFHTGIGVGSGVFAVDIAERRTDLIRFVCKANQRYYLRVNAASGSTSTGTLTFLFAKAPLAKGPGGGAWRPSNIMALGRWSETFAWDINAAANTFTKTVPTVQPGTGYKFPGRTRVPDTLGLLSEPKLANTTYVLAWIAYEDPSGTGASNSVSSIACSTGSFSTWTQLLKNQPGGTVINEVWIARVIDEIDQGSTWTVTLANNSGQKGGLFYAVHGIDPTAPVAVAQQSAYLAGTVTTAGGAQYNTDTDFSSASATRKKWLIVATWLINQSPTTNTLGGNFPWEKSLKGFASSGISSRLPGESKRIFNSRMDDGTGTRPGSHAFVVGEMREDPPHPTYNSVAFTGGNGTLAAGHRNLGFGFVSSPVSANFGVAAALLAGAPQS